MMITVGYFNGTRRAGLLAWRENEDGSTEALGGVAPEERGITEGPDAVTIVSTDAGDRELSGWVHPDDIREISGGYR